MTTRATIERYFERLGRGDRWDEMLADDLHFASFASPGRQVRGREAFIQATKRFYTMIASVQLRELIVEGDRSVALTRYELRPPNGAPAFASDVAEIFTVRDGSIASLSIYFDSAPFPR
jgi:ketosteroid isomerase-like protein